MKKSTVEAEDDESDPESAKAVNVDTLDSAEGLPF